MATSLAFNEQFYLSQNPDVAAAVSRGQFASAQQHFNLNGRFEGRDPNAFFDTSFYLSQYPDVANARVNPLEHFLNFGAAEGRFANATIDGAIDSDGNNLANEFNATAYLAANPDLAAAVGPGKAFATPFQHFTLFGQFEGRPGTPAGGPFTNTGTAPNAGSTIVLTSGLDIVNGTTNTTVTQPATVFTTSANDTIVATNATINAGDQINGLGGTDTLRVTATGAVDTSGASITNVEVVELIDAGTFPTANLAGVANLTTVNVTGLNNALAVSGLKSTVATNATGLAGDLTLTYSDAGATGSQTTTVGLNAATAGTVSTAGIETVNVTSSGAASTVTGVTAAAATALNVNAGVALNLGNVTTAADSTVTVSGAGAVSFENSAGTLKAINASANTGGVNVTGVVASDLAFTGGSGNDRISFGTTLTTADTVDGGAGRDTIAIATTDLTDPAASGVLSALNTKVTNVEVLEFTGASSVISGGTGATAFTNSTVDQILFNTAGSDTVNLAGARLYSFGNANNGDATFNSALGQTTLNLSLIGGTTAAGAAAGVDTLTANGASTINIASTGSTTAANTIDSLAVTANSVINITGSQALTISGVTAGSSINGAAATGKLTIAGSTVADSITGGAANDVLAGLGGADTIVGGAGNDIIAGDGAVTQNLPVQAEIQTIDLNTISVAATETLTVTFSGVTYTYTNGTGAPVSGAALATAVAGVINPTSTADATAGGTVVTVNQAAGFESDVGAATVGGTGVTGAEAAVIATTQEGRATAVPLSIGTVTTAAADTLTGGAGNDNFVFATNSSIVTAFDTITDLNLGSNAVGGRVDVLTFQNAGATAATIVTLNTTQQSDVTSAASFAAAVNAVAAVATADGATTQFTYGSDTYIFHSGAAGSASFDAAADHIVRVTGVVGTLDASDIVTIG